ncbi:hypothetical protein OG765_20460 [Streptomyces sp. NBC_00555]|uniref:hypothetical protein n=1 Tax=Streptomyces sp. NBC_00555 TaxID=2903662 RepID=UPI00224E1FF9|nr:hypothetical protein [Streptomyces sp. NBC_00555]MCX5013344.1 hypothetical protein [Streptomyces sp. NBC_00555]
MTYGRESIDLPEDQGCLRWVLGVPLTLIHLLNAFWVYAAVRYGPQGEWDDRGYTRIATACLIGICLSVIGLLITLIPSVRRAMGLWWLVPPFVLGVIAWVRIATLE